MITVIENTHFVEGIFSTHEDAEDYMMDHLKKEHCRLIDTSFAAFPLYIIELNYGEFIYVSPKDAIIEAIKKSIWIV